MRIRLAILENDAGYLRRIVAAFNIKYADKMEIYSFTDKDVALRSIEESKIDVLVASDSFDIDSKKIPSRCGFAYFVDNVGIETYKEEKAICKFQKADLIYKQILSVYSEVAAGVTGIYSNGRNMKIIAFTSASGGTGCSAAAAACCCSIAKRGKKVLYLNLEQLGDTEIYFKGEGNSDFGDVIYALKSSKANLHLKLESTVKQDKTGVYYYASPKIALDMMEISLEDIQKLLSEIRISGLYDYVILDFHFSFQKINLTIWKEANAVVLVTDGELLANTKLIRLYYAFSILEQKDEALRFDKAVILYNKFSNKTGNRIAENRFMELGGIPRYEHATINQVIEQTSSMNIFDKLL